MRPNPRYTAVAIALHWAMAAALIGMVVLGMVMTKLPKTAPVVVTLFQWHKSIGVTLLLLTVARIVWRLLNPPPPLPPMPNWQRISSTAVHIAFYVLMLLIPLAGWAIVSTSKIRAPTLLFESVLWPHLPVLADTEGALRKTLHTIAERAHGGMAKLMGALLLLHVGAALKHQFVDRDDLLGRMLPGIVRADPPLRPGRGIWWAVGAALGLFLIVILPARLFAAPVSGSAASSSGGNVVDDARWRMNSEHGEIVFSGRHESREFTGVFGSWHAEADFDPAHLPEARLELMIDAASARTGDAFYDATLKTEDWFDVHQHPMIRVVARDFAADGEGRYQVTGQIIMLGQETDVRFPVAIRLQDGQAEAEGSLVLDRIRLGLGTSSDLDAEWIAREVDLHFRVRAARSLAAPS